MRGPFKCQLIVSPPPGILKSIDGDERVIQVTEGIASLRSTIFASAILLSCAAGAQAEPEPGTRGFKTPSQNIHCLLDDFGVDTGTPIVLRCDILKTTNASPPRPQWCEYEWGSSFALTQNKAKGEYMCVGDTVASDDWATLGYGDVWQAEGFTCRSERTGLTCINAFSNGFTLSKASQKLF